MERFLSLSEIAEATQRLSLRKLPTSRYGWQKRARAEGWDDNDQLKRMRKGVGGGVEYHVSLLPEAMQAALAAEVSRDVATSNANTQQAVDTVKREVLDTSALSARQRAVMTARGAVLSAIEAARITHGQSLRQAVLAFVAAPDVSAETLATANDRGDGKSTPSARTIMRWFQFKEESGLGALAPKTTKKVVEIPKWFWDFMRYYARPQKPCITEALDKFLDEERPNEEVTYSRVRRMLQKLGNVERHRGREGHLTLKARLAYVTRSTGDLLPACIYTGDGKTFDAEVAHPHHGGPFRPEITSIVDVATRRCVGFSVGLVENAEGVVDALRHACETNGIPAIFYVDLGAGFKNKRLDEQLTGLLGRLGTTKLHSRALNSQARGIIERFNGSVWNPLAREYKTYVGVDMDRQARQKSFKITRREMREFGASKSLMPFEEFRDRCAKAIAAYNAKPHASLPNRMSPDAYWQSHVENGFEPVLVTEAESAELFRPYVRRKVSRCLIQYGTNKYFSDDLQEYHGDDVLVGFDIHNADHIWVRQIDILDGEEVPGRLICIAQFNGNTERYIPLTTERRAMEKRAASRTRRLQEKQREIEAELNPPLAIDHQPMPTMPEIKTPGEIVEGTLVSAETASLAPPRMLRFRSDAELAQWALDNPDQLHPRQINTLAACLGNAADRQLLVDCEIDVPALTDIIRAALDETPEQRRANQ